MNIRVGNLPTEAWWPKALDAGRSDSAPVEDQSLEILARRRDPKKVARAALAAADAAFTSARYRHFAKHFIMAWEMVRGQQWPSSMFQESPSWRIRVTRNKLFGATEQIAALMMDILPEAFVVPEPGSEALYERSEAMRRLGLVSPEADALFADRQADNRQLEAITRVIQAEHEHRSEHQHLTNLLADMVVAGLGIEKLFWNDDERVVDVKQIYPLDFGIDPKCQSRLMRGAKYVVLRKSVDIEDVIERFDPPRSVLSKLRAEGRSEYDRLFATEGTSIQDAFPDLMFPTGTRDTVETLVRDQIELREVWYLGERSFEFEHPEPVSGELTAGRVVMVVPGLEEPLYDGDNPNPNGELPFVLYQNHGDGRNPYTYGDVEPSLGNQIGLNIILSAMAMSSVLNQNAQWLHEEGAWTQGTPDNRPGGDFEVASNKLNRVQRLPGIEIPQSQFNLVAMLDKSIVDVTGVSETTLGAPPQTHTPAYAIQLSQTMNLAQLRTRGRMLEAAWRRRSRLEVQLVIAYAALLKRRGSLYQDLGEYFGLGAGLQNLHYDIKMASKTEMPVGFINKLQFALEGLDRGLMDRLAAAKFTEYPVDPAMRELWQLQRDTALMQAQMMYESVRAQQAQGLQGAPPGAGPPTPITAGRGMPPGIAGQPAGVTAPNEAVMQAPSVSA